MGLSVRKGGCINCTLFQRRPQKKKKSKMQKKIRSSRTRQSPRAGGGGVKKRSGRVVLGRGDGGNEQWKPVLAVMTPRVEKRGHHRMKKPRGGRKKGGGKEFRT